MRFYEYLKEKLKIGKFDFAYGWVSHKGKVHKIPEKMVLFGKDMWKKGGHTYIIQKHLKTDSHETAFNKGWIKFEFQRNGSVELEFRKNKVTEKAIQALIPLLKGRTIFFVSFNKNEYKKFGLDIDASNWFKNKEYLK
jgi:hypothetical protein